jgi:hypothetical protein
MSDPAPPAAVSGGVSFLHKFSSSKGSTIYAPNQSFLLHVIWQAPSAAAAQELLSGLSTCAAATQRDTPCVPTYFFRVAPSYHDVCSPAPLLLKDHPHITQVDAFEAAFDFEIQCRLCQCPSTRHLTSKPSTRSHRRLLQAHRKLLMGIPPAAIKAELLRRRLPPDLLDRDLEQELPEDLRAQPVMVEFTEVYAPIPALVPNH